MSQALFQNGIPASDYDIAKLQPYTYICFDANRPVNKCNVALCIYAFVNLELCNVTGIINVFRHNVKCQFSIITSYLLEYYFIYNKKLIYSPNKYLRLLHSFPGSSIPAERQVIEEICTGHICCPFSQY